MSINANELRIGNLLRYCNSEILAVKSINESGLNFDKYDRYWESISDFSPIPLTEDILIKCGFEKTPYGMRIEIGSSYNKGYSGFEFSNYNNKYISYWYATEKGEHGCKNIYLHKPKYLHQLQNLYFALTNEELKIDL